MTNNNNEINNNPNEAPTGHLLGGSSAAVSQEELRRRRLANLERHTNKTTATPQKPKAADVSSAFSTTTPSTLLSSNLNKQVTISTSATSPSPVSKRPDPPEQKRPSTPVPPIVVDDDYDEDAELQAALALSLAGDAATADTMSVQDDDDPLLGGGGDANDDEDTPEKQLEAALKLSLEQQDTSIAVAPEEPPAPLPLEQLLQEMETDTLPTLQNQKSYTISTSPTNALDFHCIMWDYPQVTHINDQQRWLCQGIHFKNVDGTFRTDNLLAGIISNHEVWGLSQSHGGPCGVLAAIQAEVLRIVIFGGRRRQNNSNVPFLEYPITSSNQLAQGPCDLSPALLQQGLAKAISIILARAAIMPSATLQDSSDGTPAVALAHANTHATIRLVLPKDTSYNVLEWERLAPWTADAGESGLSDHLVTVTITPTQSGGGAAASSPSLDMQDTKRHKPEPNLYTIETELAYACAEFLLDSGAIELFQRPGGILLMVLSLAMSRGIPQLQGDMDDATAKLTSNFGHCSQELINLLLTGQAGTYACLQDYYSYHSFGSLSSHRYFTISFHRNQYSIQCFRQHATTFRRTDLSRYSITSYCGVLVATRVDAVS